MSLPDHGRRWTDEQVAESNVLAFEAGRRHERERIAVGVAELDATWRPIGRRRYGDVVAERVALFERCAHQLASDMGRPAGYAYRGGPVDWETGRPRIRMGVAA